MKPSSRIILLSLCTFLLTHTAEASRPRSLQKSGQKSDDVFELSLEELLDVNVSSQRFDQPFREVTRPLSVVTNDQLRANQVDSIFDLALLVPNFSLHRSFGRLQERPVIRGISALTGEPTAGLLIDGISSSNIVPTLSLHDIERVEVLRGPEAALFGRSTFAGAINFIGRRPSLSENQFEFISRNGNNSYADVSLWGSKYFSDSLALSISAKSYARDNSIENKAGTGGDGYGEEASELASFATTWQASNEINVYYRYVNQHDEDGQLPVYLQNRRFNNCFLESTPEYYCGEIRNPKNPGYSNLENLWDFFVKKDIQRHFLETFYQTDQRDLKFIANFTEVDDTSRGDGDYYELDSIFNRTDNQRKNRDLELTANHYFERVRVLYGAAWSDKSRDYSFNNQRLANDALVSLGYDSSESRVANLAIFSSLDYELNSALKLSVDLRQARDRVAYELASGEVASEKWHKLSPRMNLSWTFANKQLLYFSVAKGHRPGGFNDAIVRLATIDDAEKQRLMAFHTFDEEKLLAWDAGFKGELINKRLFVSADVFYYDWTALQLAQSLSYRNSSNNLVRVSSIINGGSATTAGAELEMEAVLTDRLSSRVSLGYVSSEMHNTSTTAHFDLTGDGSVNGKRIPNVPEITGFIALQYHRPAFADYQFVFNTSAHYESERYVAEHNLATIGDDFGLNAMASLGRNNWSIFLWGKNLTNNDTPESVARLGDAATFFVKRGFGISLPEVRQVGLGLDYVLSAK